MADTWELQTKEFDDDLGRLIEYFNDGVYGVLWKWGLHTIRIIKRDVNASGVNDTGTFQRSIMIEMVGDEILIHDGVPYGVNLELGSDPHKVAVWEDVDKPARDRTRHDLTSLGRWMLRKAKVPFGELKHINFITVSNEAHHFFLNGYDEAYVALDRMINNGMLAALRRKSAQEKFIKERENWI